MIDLSYLGLDKACAAYNLQPAALVEEALRRGEGSLSENGALVVRTGAFTGRSPESRFIVDDPEVHDDIAWGNVNRPVSPETFEALWNETLAYLNGRQLYVFDGLAGTDRSHAKRFRVINELAAQNLFIHQLLVRPTAEELAEFEQGDRGSQRDQGGQDDYVGFGGYTVLAAPDLKLNLAAYGINSEAIVALDLTGKRILIAGTKYSGEIKKAIFTVMNYVMPDEGVLPMHCSANCDPESGDVAIFFGLSGTGKTTLSTDSSRLIIGDDEHGWSADGVFNFEGGCYAKCIDLTYEKEPEVFNAIRFGSVVENVAMDPNTRRIDFADGSITNNTRGSYPISHIPGAVKSGKALLPNTIILLTADAFGVLPPISRLTPEAAMYHFVTGFTSKVAGTECGVNEPIPTFSSMFGEPFMPRPASVYASMLGERLKDGGIQVYLINTGWAGGGACDGADRIPLSYTRAMVNAVLQGSLSDASFRHDEVFNVDVPLDVEGVPSELLDPRAFWIAQGRTGDEYDAAANSLARLFQENFASKHAGMDQDVADAGPKPRA